MSKILAFAGSNSSTSINQKLVKHIVSSIENHDTKLINLIDYPLPIYGEDEEKKGFPEMTTALQKEISESDGLIISVNEHNGSWSAFFKNIIDWLSRLDRNFLEGKKVLLLSTSPGKRGGLSALEFGKSVLPRFGAEIVGSLSFPSFYDNFSEESNTITDKELLLNIKQVLDIFTKEI
ncbi:NADPH-dependent FMN reductase [Aquimarina algicola]|uniref:NAD(P)H-dependent oxidoreductase n=1 Tax=Aquimarina algicola TaxID=2589995 RepID=A0A504J2D1_9FLAO|nr:NADPH-dependent FMN reductase [Aquimarina algicola]TPN82168.1 NAD(P)H-dependent oxidoreductase [Aquimarina algicola]